jgi:beta-galactosidase
MAVMKLGVCYYPEHWPESSWAVDARAMRSLGLSLVRIGEFAWSRIEPTPGYFNFGWLDRAIDTLHGEGLGVVLCTPTATPPKWLVDRDPDCLAVGENGAVRRFGSRRHYCFSSRSYREEAARITRVLAERYGRHPAVRAWQTDNEYGCHGTVVSLSADASARFRDWLQERYGTIEALNDAWGTVFWSQEYGSFGEIDPPYGTVTTANPSHRLDYRRFASDEVVSFNRLQADILRAGSPGRDILHNYMGAFTEFDHYRVGADLDAAAWDSYPLGFLEQGDFPDAVKKRFMRQGHPDFTAFHHDLYRHVGRGRWWVMEQQPGPVNWAAWNPAPLPGMVRCWTWEAFAHGAEVVSYFRWRQAPFAQEQNHAGLNRPDGEPAPAFAEAGKVASEIGSLGETGSTRSAVALVFDYQAQWCLDIERQGADFSYAELCLGAYSALRRLGLDIDIVSPEADLNGYDIAVIPSLPIAWPSLVSRLAGFAGHVVIGPRSGSLTETFRIPPALPPGPLQSVLPLRVVRRESLRPGHVEPGDFPATRWLEHIETTGLTMAATASGDVLWTRAGRFHYLAGWPSAELLDAVLRQACAELGMDALDLPDGLRTRRRGDVRFAFNYGTETVDLGAHIPSLDGASFLLGDRVLAPAGVAAWRRA